MRSLGRIVVWLGVGSVSACGLAQAPSAEEGSDRELRILKQFQSEFVDLRPGEAPYPEHQCASPAAAGDQPKELAPFAIARYEVTQELYEVIMRKDPSRWKGPRNSAEMMTSGEAREFCRKVTARLQRLEMLAKDREIRLPTECEWEYACRAGTTTRYSFGDEALLPDQTDLRTGLISGFAWFHGNAAGNDPPVGALKPNPWGLYDMHGYLWEIVALTGDSDDGDVVLRGGSWKDSAENVTSASRRTFGAGARDDAVGFRCVRARQSSKGPN